jgi:hypothetical protein
MIAGWMGRSSWDGAMRDRASWFESPRRLLFGGSDASAGNERRWGDYDSNENQSNQ